MVHTNTATIRAETRALAAMVEPAPGHYARTTAGEWLDVGSDELRAVLA